MKRFLGIIIPIFGWLLLSPQKLRQFSAEGYAVSYYGAYSTIRSKMRHPYVSSFWLISWTVETRSKLKNNYNLKKLSYCYIDMCINKHDTNMIKPYYDDVSDTQGIKRINIKVTFVAVVLHRSNILFETSFFPVYIDMIDFTWKRPLSQRLCGQ